MPDCGKVKRGQTPPCEPAAAGLKTDLVLVRYDDIAAVVSEATNPKIKKLVLKTGKKGFLFKGIGDSNAGRAKLVPGKYAGAYTHEFDMVAFSVAPEDLSTVEDLAKDRVVAVIKDNNGFTRLYGANAGLTASKAETDTANKDTGGAPELTLSSDKEKGLADVFGVMDTTGQTPVLDPVATQTAFEALYT